MDDVRNTRIMIQEPYRHQEDESSTFLLASTISPKRNPPLLPWMSGGQHLPPMAGLVSQRAGRWLGELSPVVPQGAGDACLDPLEATLSLSLVATLAENPAEAVILQVRVIK